LLLCCFTCIQLGAVAAAVVGGKVGKAKEAYEKAVAAALRQQERAKTLAEIIASQFQRVKVGRAYIGGVKDTTLQYALLAPHCTTMPKL
jgi:hypothetical protein